MASGVLATILILGFSTINCLPLSKFLHLRGRVLITEFKASLNDTVFFSNFYKNVI